MSSVLSSYSQVAPRDRFLNCTVAAAASAFSVNAGGYLPYKLTTTQLAAAGISNRAVTVGKLYRDLGRTLTVVDPTTRLIVSRWVYAQEVSGAGGNEGASAVFSYILVWDANAAPPTAFARVG